MAAELPDVQPDVLIVESTFGVQVLEPVKAREKLFTGGFLLSTFVPTVSLGVWMIPALAISVPRDHIKHESSCLSWLSGSLSSLPVLLVVSAVAVVFLLLSLLLPLLWQVAFVVVVADNVCVHSFYVLSIFATSFCLCLQTWCRISWPAAAAA